MPAPSLGTQPAVVTIMTNSTYSITDAWAASTTSRMKKGGDLYRRPLTREEMTAPLAWHEKHLAVCRRYGMLADGSIGSEIVR